MKTSFIIISRERQGFLYHCIQQIILRAAHPENVEIVVVADDDDVTFYDFEGNMQFLYPSLDIRLYRVPRSRHWQRDYSNFAATKTTGDIIWGLNDDSFIQTDQWDVVLQSVVEEIYANQKDRMLYIGMPDGSHGPTGQHVHQPSCCFPIISRETYLQLGCIFPSEIDMWGGDIALYEIFELAGEKRFFYTDKLLIEHNSSHSSVSPRERDAGYWHVAELSKKTTLTLEEKFAYVQRLNAGIVL